MFDSISTAAVRSALDGLAARQRATADNIANINTPHYLASRVDFEGALRQAVGSGSGSAATTVSQSVAPTREDGNNVNLDVETLSSTDTQLRYQLLTQAASTQLGMVSAAIRTS